MSNGDPGKIDMRTLAVGAVLIVGAGACVAQSAPPPVRQSYSSATADFAGAGQPGEWTSQARDYANTRFSPLAQIDASNVGKLRLAWSFSDGTQYGHEGAPLVVGDTM
jgi:glucose dehydrogenase